MTLRGMYCRTCLCVLQRDLNQCPLAYNIYDTLHFAKKLMLCTNTRIQPYDQFPNSVCTKCYEKVLEFYEFQIMCRDSLRMFNEISDFGNDLEEALCNENYFKIPNKRKQKEEPNLNAHFQDKQNKHYISKARHAAHTTNTESCKSWANRPQEAINICLENIKEPQELPSEAYNANDHFIIEGQVKNSIKNETKYEEDQHESNCHIENLESDILIPNVDAIFNEIDVYTENDNFDNFEDNLFGLLAQHDPKLENDVENSVEKVNNEAPTAVDGKKEANTSTVRVTRSATRLELKSQGQQVQPALEGSKLNEPIQPPLKPENNFRFACSICSKKFRFYHTSEAHKRWHEGLPGYACNRKNCERTFERFLDLQDHLRDHDGIPRAIYKCEIKSCDREFARKCGLSLHMKQAHKCLPTTRTHVCETCGKIFYTEKRHREHTFIHQDKSTWLYTCDFEGCQRKCRTFGLLKLHKNRHTGIKKFVCPYCGIAKTTSQELKSHVNHHTLERTWSCEHCTKVCKTLANFNRHMKNKHSGPKREYKCDFCDAAFSTIEVKKSHEKRHTSDMPHKCEECGMRFIWAYKLKAHLKAHL